MDIVDRLREATDPAFELSLYAKRLVLEAANTIVGLRGQMSAASRQMARDAEHRVSQTLPWPPTPESMYMLTRFTCSAGDWDSGSIRDVRGNDLIEVARRDGERHVAEHQSLNAHHEGSTE